MGKLVFDKYKVVCNKQTVILKILEQANEIISN